MRELLRSNDLVYLSFAMHVLNEAEIEFLQLDTHMSALEGSIGAFPRRLLIPSDHARQARRLLRDAGLAGELRDA